MDGSVDNLANLFRIQSITYNGFKNYQNEFETMRFLFDMLSEKRKELVRGLSLHWLEDLEQNENTEFDLKDVKERERESKDLRQEGNRLFTAKGDKRNVLGACRLYNDAIYAALDTHGEELPLGFANRAMALQNFGYYQQAYDDCCYALKLGYPNTLRHKIIMRQVYCSLKMNKLETAEKHLNELKVLELGEGFAKELNNLLLAFDEQRNIPALDDDTSAIDKIPMSRETQEIISKNDGRYMQAKCPIEKNELIFTERASAFVAVGDTRRMCHQCGTLNFIPFPCLYCRGRVNYCSVKCLEKHSGIHVYECRAYRMQLFAHVGIAHLALRTVLDDGLLTVLNDLKLDSKTSTFDVWHHLSVDGDIWNSNNQYAESLRMISHLNKLSNNEIIWYALVSHHLVVYLKQYTKYFDDLSTASKKIDWELLTGSLILRHNGQLISNGHSLTAIVPHPLTLMTTTDFHLLNENVWSSPWHLKLGCLHFYSNYDVIASLNLPYLSLCNHSCVQLFQTKFSGRFISTYALRNIKKGEEITNCYDIDYRKKRREARRKRLKETYHFDCRCENCLETKSEDEEFNKFYQYRCDNIECGKSFVSSTPEIHTFDFLQADLANPKVDTNLYCTICGQKQTLKWYHEVVNLMPSFTESRSRRRLYEIFKQCEQYLVGLNKARCFLAQKMVHEWFNMFWTNYSLEHRDYCDLIDVIKYILNVTRELSSVNSSEYITYMVFLWDLIAKRKYKCSKSEMEEMLWALSIVSDDLKVIFLNYYNDYIKDYLCL